MLCLIVVFKYHRNLSGQVSQLQWVVPQMIDPPSRFWVPDLSVVRRKEHVPFAQLKLLVAVSLDIVLLLNLRPCKIFN